MSINYLKTLFYLLFLLSVSVGAFAQQTDTLIKNQTDTLLPKIKQDRVLIDEVIAIVGNKMILLSELESAYKQYKEQKEVSKNIEITDAEKVEILNNMLLAKLLALNAIADSLPEDQIRILSDVEVRVADMVSQVGSVGALEKHMGIPIYTIKDLLRQQMTEENLSNAMRMKIIENVKITPLEVKKMMKTISKDSLEIIPRQLIYAQITKETPKDYNSKMNVKAEIIELRRRIVEDGDSFSGLARVYSKDRATAFRGGEMDYAPLTLYVPPFSQALKNLKPGQISGVVETEFGYHIIQAIDFKNGQYKCRHILMKTEFDGDQLNNAMLFLDSLSNDIKAGKISFADAALKHSEDISSRSNDGVVINSGLSDRYGVRNKSNKFYEDEIGMDYQYLKDLQIGEVSESFKSYNSNDNVVCKIVKLIAIIPQHVASYEEDYQILEDLALSRKKEATFMNWVNQKITKMYIKIEKPYKNWDFEFPWTR